VIPRVPFIEMESTLVGEAKEVPLIESDLECRFPFASGK
jgi:hypothetical protein